MQTIDQGLVANSITGSDRQSLAFPGVCVLSSGRWLISLRAGPAKASMEGQHPLLCWSDDEGATWSEPTCPFQPPQYDGTSGSFRAAYVTELADNRLVAALCWVDDSDPTRPFFNEATEGLLDTRICLSHSRDNGASWSLARFVDSELDSVPTPLTGPIICLGGASDRQQLAIQLEINKSYLDQAPWHHQSVLLFSHDGGRNWTDHVVASDDPELRIFYWDQRPSVVGDNQLLNLFWTFDRLSGEYLNIHARRSPNNGRDWSLVWDTGVPGQPAPALRLADGRLAMVYVDRTTQPTIKLRTSDDDGHRWPVKSERTLFPHNALPDLSRLDNLSQPGNMQTAWDEMSRFALGLPATALLKGGDALVVFYAGPAADTTSIHWQRLRL